MADVEATDLSLDVDDLVPLGLEYLTGDGDSASFSSCLLGDTM